MFDQCTLLVLTIFVLIIKSSFCDNLLHQYVKDVKEDDRTKINLITNLASYNINQRIKRNDNLNVFNYSASTIINKNLNNNRSGEQNFASGSDKKSISFVSTSHYNDVTGKINSNDRTKRNTNDDFNQWTHWEYLDSEKNVLLKWQPRHQEILFRVEARTLGYIGVGFSLNGGMEDADMVMGWVDDTRGRAFLMDCHGADKNQGSAPVRDEIDNYTLMKGAQNDTHTILEFRRALDTCDPDDYILNVDTVRVIWALHEKDPQYDFEMIYHGARRGSQSLHLLGPPPVQDDDDNQFIRKWDVILRNYEVKNNMNTIYWCKIFKAPTLQQKHHIIGYEPIIGKNHTNFVHHMLLHECELDASVNINKWNEYSRQEGKFCYAPEMPVDWDKCITPVIAWAVGSKGENFPKHVGLPLNNKKIQYYMLEIHFDNLGMKRAVDTSGIRIRYTRNLRQNDGAILVTGIFLSSLQVVPPLQAAYKSVGYCSSDCTREIFPKDGVNVVSVLLHSHLAGRKLKLRHIRGEKELAPLVEDDHYDFNYQQSRTLSHEIKILPGDSLVTECTYSTIQRKKPTLGGYSTTEEMCLAFILHYPKTELAGCYSMPPIKYFFETLGVKEFYNANMSDVENMILHGSTDSSVTPSTPKTPLFSYKPGDENSPEANARAILAIKNAKEYTIEGDSSSGVSPFEKLIIKEPQEFRNKSFMAHLEDIPYHETLLTKKIEEYFYKGLHLTFCRKRDDTLAIRENVERFPNFTQYKTNKTEAQCSYRTRITSGQNLLLEDNVLVFLALFSFYFNVIDLRIA